MDELLPLLAALLPTNAVLPSSLRQLRQVLGVQRPSRWAHYACRSGKCFLKPLQEGQDPLQLPPCDCDGQHAWFEEVLLPNGRTVSQATGQVRASAVCSDTLHRRGHTRAHGSPSCVSHATGSRPCSVPWAQFSCAAHQRARCSKCGQQSGRRRA